MPEIDISKLARLDERDAPAPSEEASHAAPGAFAPPGEGADDALGVERSTRAIRIESEWLRERAVKHAAAAVPPPKPRLRIGGVVVACAAIAVVIAAVVLVMRYERAPVPAPAAEAVPQRGGASVSIRITAHDVTEVRIDGQRAGKTPLTLQRPRSAQAIRITAPNVVREVVPDRDQVVDLSPP